MYKRDDIVIIGNKKYRILSYDEVASKVYRSIHYRCRLIGRNCIDSYPESKMKGIK